MNDLSEYHSLLDMFEQVEEEYNIEPGSILSSLVDEYNARTELLTQKEETKPVYEH